LNLENVMIQGELDELKEVFVNLLWQACGYSHGTGYPKRLDSFDVLHYEEAIQYALNKNLD